MDSLNADAVAFPVLDSGERTTNVTVSLRLCGPLDRVALRGALSAFLARHEILRTTFREQGGALMQSVSPPAAVGVQLTEQDLGLDQDVHFISQLELAHPLQLSTGPLIRFRLLRRSDWDHVLLVTQHKMITDKHSIRELLCDLTTFYNVRAGGEGGSVSFPDIQCADRVSVLTSLPTDMTRNASHSRSVAVLPISLSADLTARLKKFSDNHAVAPLVSWLSGLAIAICRWSDQDELRLGAAVESRTLGEQAPRIGVLRSVAPLRLHLTGDQTVDTLIAKVGTTLSEAREHSKLAFEAFIGSASDNAASIVSARTDFNLSVSLTQSDSALTGTLEYAADLFRRETIEALAACWISLLEEMFRNPHSEIHRLPLLTAADRERVLYGFNATHEPYSQDRLIHEWFEEQARQTPQAVAVVYEGQSLTYAQLNARASQLARHLRAKGVGADQRVGICVERSPQMVVGLLGILKAGGAYVPLDPSYPSERLQYMLKDCAPRVLLTQAHFAETLSAPTPEVVVLDRDWEQIAQHSTENLNTAALGLRPDHLAYVIYTSGSTGQPKGVMVRHAELLNYLQWAVPQYAPPQAGEAVAVSSPLAFDATITSLFCPLLSGLRVVLLPDGQELEGLERLLQQPTQWCLIKISPAHLQALGERLQPLKPRCSVRTFVIGGEALPPATVALWQSIWPQTRLINEYGPTETVVGCCIYEVPLGYSQASSVPIGRPIANTRIYLLDRHREPVPVGVIGEIYIAGAGVARGYLNRPELTAERFLEDPFGGEPTARMYRSGDLGKWRPDGTLEYLGRNDEQVKIRGYRVELGEIEARLAQHPGVSESAVLAREDVPGDKRLVAYATRRAQSELSVEALRAHVKAALPEYMVPSAFVLLKSLPLTANGKLDRRALPAPQQAAYVSGKYEPPQGELEEILAGVWQSVLRAERVGRLDNFFELGGHSLLIVQMLEKLRCLGVYAELSQVLRNVSFADMARILTRTESVLAEIPPNLIPAECEALTPAMLSLVQLSEGQIARIVQAIPGGAANIQDIYPLSPLQEGLLFHSLLDPRCGDPYIMPLLLRLSSREKLEDLIAALQFLIDRHDVLRTAVLWEDLPTPVQVVLRRATLPIEMLALEADPDPVEQLQSRMRPEHQRMDLRRAPLMQLQIVQHRNGSQWYALLQVHHLIHDHESMDVMLAEVVAHMSGHAQRLPDPMPYRAHVAQVLAHARTHDAQAFFCNKLGDIDEPTAPFGFLDVQGDGTRTQETRERVDRALEKQLRIQSRRLGMPVAALVHAAWALVVARTSGRDDVVFGTLLSGRLQGTAGAQNILGVFINTLPLRLRLQEITARELLDQTQQELLELLSHEQASLALAQRCSGIGGNVPPFSTLLNYLHATHRPAAEQALMESGVELLATREWTNYPVVFSVEDQEDGLLLIEQVDQRIGAGRMTCYLQTALASLLAALERKPETPALLLQVLPERERQQVIESFNPPRPAYSQERLIHELFEEQVRRTPSALAIVREEQSLTYAQLNARANQLARHLRAKGVTADQPVGICVERSLEMVVGLLGILKAGGGYVPLDPSYPSERLQYMLKDCSPRVLLTQARFAESLQEVAAEVVLLDQDWGQIAQHSAENPNAASVGLRPDHLAYVIYTSGSTGQPKGVMVEHRNVSRLFAVTEALFGFNERDVWTLFHSFAFDFSVWELWGALLYGGRLIVVPAPTARSPLDFYELLCRQGVTVLNQTPSAFVQLISAQTKAQHRLRVVIFGGEALELRALQPWVERNGAERPQLVNMYGITETTVHVTFRAIAERDFEFPRRNSVGRPLADLRVYVLDRQRQPAPVGVVGEVYVGGAGVARGYLNRPELTEQRFVSDPYRSDPDARLYKTGDLGRWCSDGTLEYLGRNDLQVKIRGYRIELGEIEAQLLRHPAVKEAAVLAPDVASGEKLLVGYVSSREADLSLDTLRAHLRQALPDHMVPAALVILPDFPLTQNGKLDRSALPSPELGAFATHQYEPPQGDTEHALAALWRELLCVERVGRKDNFFDLGGHSISAMQMVSRIRSSLSVNISMSAVLNSSDLQTVAAKIEQLRERHLEEGIPGDETIDRLLERVMSLPEDQVRHLMRELKRERTQP